MKLAYRAVERSGKAIHGTIEAKDITEAAGYLRSKDILPIKIYAKKETDLRKYIPFLNKTKGDIVLFTRQLSSMISSGLTLLQSLRLLQDEVSSTQIKAIIRGIITDIEDGSSFSKALEHYEDVFGNVYISLVKAAETSGLLDKILLRLSENLEKQQ